MIIIKKILGCIIRGFAIIYGFNIIMQGIDIFVPINIFSVLLTSILGFPALILLLGVKFML